MKFEIPKVTRFLPLQEYDPDNKDLAGIGIQVWVDPPDMVLKEFDALNWGYRMVLNELVAKPGKEPNRKPRFVEHLLGWIKLASKKDQDSKFQSETDSYRRSLAAWYARQWSQSPDAATHWTPEELERINDENPRLYEWLCISTWALIEKQRVDVKKGWRGPSANLPAAGEPATPSSKLISSPNTSTPPPAGR